MKPIWIVQSNLIAEETFETLNRLTTEQGYECRGLKIIPFTDSPEFLADLFFEWPKAPLIPYGSTSMIKMMARTRPDCQGLFFNQENLRTSKWVQELGTRVLNHDAKFMTLAQAFELQQGQFFMKPDNDLKDFSGGFVEAHEIRKFYDQVSAGGFCFGTDIPVVLSPVKNTGWEYRLFMIRDQVITASSYKLKQSMNKTKRVPKDVLQFAVETGKIWRPDDVYVMDVCETDEGLKVVEFNCVNGSGFYNCDVGAIVKAISEFVDQKTCSFCNP